MSQKDWVYPDGNINPEYAELTPAEQQMLEAITDMLYDVTYAKAGTKTAKRRETALAILTAIKVAYKVHTKGNDLLTDDPDTKSRQAKAQS